LHKIRHLRVETRKHSEKYHLKAIFWAGGGGTAEITDILKDPNVALLAAWTINILRLSLVTIVSDASTLISLS
jgi:hypothetical protein